MSGSFEFVGVQDRLRHEPSWERERRGEYPARDGKYFRRSERELDKFATSRHLQTRYAVDMSIHKLHQRLHTKPTFYCELQVQSLCERTNQNVGDIPETTGL